MVKSQASLAAVVFAMTACAHVDPHAANIRGVAYVRVDYVIKHHPLYGQLDQLNNAIAAINLEASLPQAPLTAAQIAAQTQSLNAQLKAAEEKTTALLTSKRESYQQQEHDADVAALKAANIDPAAAGLGSAMNATSQQQAQAAAIAAQSDFAQYQASVVSQDSAAARSIAQQLGNQADSKYQAKAEEDQQDETDLSLRLAQQDASQRLAYKTKLTNLAMDADARKAVADGLAALDKKEADQVGVMHAQHVRDLTAFRAQLAKDTNAAIAKQMTTLRGETNAKLSARQAQVGAQLRSLGGAPVASQSLPPDIVKKLQDIHQQFAIKFQADGQSAMNAYNQTKDDLNNQFAALHGQNVGAVGAAAKQRADLQKRYDALQAQIQSQIQTESERLAKEMGFSVVFDNVNAAPGGYDMTNDVLHDIESLHE